MIVSPKVKGFICITAHPKGCEKYVEQQIAHIKSKGSFNGPKRVLVIGASTGYGLASRIAASFGCQAQTIGVFFEREAKGTRTASAGWYNSVAFEKSAAKEGIYAKSINGDAFSNEIKQQVIELIKQDWNGEVDLVIYSLASPRRTDPTTGETHHSVLKPIGTAYNDKTVNILDGKVSTVSFEPATEEEVANTTKVMGGEDWGLWIKALDQAGVLAKNCKTIAYSYIGPELTYPIYRHGTIGKAKEHLEQTAKTLDELLATKYQGRALVSVNKCLVTQASSAIPVVPLYISLLYKVMKQKDIHEGCIEQMQRLFSKYLTSDFDNESLNKILDDKDRIRIDDWELRAEVQQEVTELWKKVTSENLAEIADIDGYINDFYNLFGFKLPAVNYEADVEIELEMPSAAES